MLCAGHHDNIDNGTRYEGLRLSDHIVNWSDGRRTYQIRSRDGDKEVLVEIGVNDGSTNARAGYSSDSGTRGHGGIYSQATRQEIESPDRGGD